MGRVRVGWGKNPTRDEIVLGEKSDPQPWMKIQTRTRTRRVSGVRRVL
jgi:hypothetical protein